ncbi:MAG: flagellar protein FlaG [Gallionella sp.]|nr:flagellar protein FlaG [Gallionella sp.]
MPIQNLSVVAQTSEIAGNSALGIVTSAKSVSTGSVSAKLPPAAAKQPPSIVQLQRLIESMNKTMQQNNSSLEFSVDGNSERVLVQLIDTSTGEVIRQIPSKEILAIAQSIEQMQQGLLLNKQA